MAIEPDHSGADAVDLVTRLQAAVMSVVVGKNQALEQLLVASLSAAT